MSSPFTIRFQVGKTYRLHTSQDFDRLRGGTIVVKAELKPKDLWGNRILLVDAYLDAREGGEREERLGSRCYVEEGYASIKDAYGYRTVNAEVATLQGVYPDFAKAYAVDEV